MAEFGVILLMFGVGLHYDVADLWQVRRVVIPGAVIQIAIVAAAGYGLGHAWGLSTGGAWIFGIAGSVASTVVLMRALMDHGWLDSPAGKVAIGWLVVEDLVMVAILVLVPALAAPSASGPWITVGIAIGKAILFVALMMFVGARLVPAVLGRVVHTRSRELFVLVALTMAVGTALASAQYFGVSLALGAFVAGIIVSESPFSHQIGADLLPFREAFAVIFCLGRHAGQSLVRRRELGPAAAARARHRVRQGARLGCAGDDARMLGPHDPGGRGGSKPDR